MITVYVWSQTLSPAESLYFSPNTLIYPLSVISLQAESGTLPPTTQMRLAQLYARLTQKLKVGSPFCQ